MKALGVIILLIVVACIGIALFHTASNSISHTDDSASTLSKITSND